MSKTTTSWPWAPSPRIPSPELGGDIEGAMDFLGVTAPELSRITAMVCSGIPEDIDCRAKWSPDRSDSYGVEVVNESVEFRQKFVKTSDGLCVRHDMFVLPDGHHKRGHAKRLFQNLAYLYQEMGVANVSMFADHGNGAYTWAKLGAQPLDPDLQRKLLRERLDQNAAKWSISEDDIDEIIDVLKHEPGESLMHEIASLVTADGVNVGSLLLVGHEWNGYWDLQDPKLSEFIMDAVKGPVR